MKTNQLILAAALVALAACTKENVDFNANTLDNEIGFTAVTRKATKATTDNDKIVANATYPETCAFKVWGWNSPVGDFSEFSDGDASNFMSNLTIEYTTGPNSQKAAAWRNADQYYYWPMTGEISFFAFHPSDKVPANFAPGWDATHDVPTASISGWDVTGTNKTVDLMFADNHGHKQTSALGLVFKHALAQIVVNVKTDEDYHADAQFDVNSVTFNNVYTTGDLSYSQSTYTWTPVANDTQTHDWVYSNTSMTNITNAENQVYGAACLMIPQDANTKDPNATPADNTETTITINYTITSVVAANAPAATPVTANVTVAAPQIWAAGSKYIYTLNFKLNEILFAPTVDPNWVVVNVATMDI